MPEAAIQQALKAVQPKRAFGSHHLTTEVWVMTRHAHHSGRVYCVCLCSSILALHQPGFNERVGISMAPTRLRPDMNLRMSQRGTPCMESGVLKFDVECSGQVLLAARKMRRLGRRTRNANHYRCPLFAGRCGDLEGSNYVKWSQASKTQNNYIRWKSKKNLKFHH